MADVLGPPSNEGEPPSYIVLKHPGGAPVRIRTRDSPTLTAAAAAAAATAAAAESCRGCY